MISPETVSPTKPKFNKNLVIVYVAIGLSILSIIAIVIIALTQLNVGPKDVPQITVTPSAEVTQTVIPTSVTINDSAKIFLKNAESNAMQASLLSFSADTIDNKNELGIQVNSTLSFSPDNSYLATTTSKEGLEVISFVRMDDKKQLESQIEYSSKSSYMWTSNDTFQYLNFANESLELTTIALPELETRSSAINLKQAISSASISSQLDKIIYVIEADNSVVYLNQDTGKKVSINQLDVNLTDYKNGFWLDNDNFIFYSTEGVFKFNANLLSLDKLITLRSAEVSPLNSENLLLSYDKSNLYFVYESKLFKYSFATKVTKEIFNFTSEVPLSSPVEIKITPNERFLTITYKNKSKLLDILNSELKDLCEGFCTEVVIEN